MRAGAVAGSLLLGDGVAPLQARIYSATCKVTSCSLHHRMTSSLGRSVVIMSIRVESADCAEVGGAEFAAVHGDDDASGACDDGCLIWASATSTTVMPSSVSPLAPMNAMSTLNRRCVGFEFVHEGCGRARARRAGDSARRRQARPVRRTSYAELRREAHR